MGRKWSGAVDAAAVVTEGVLDGGSRPKARRGGELEAIDGFFAAKRSIARARLQCFTQVIAQSGRSACSVAVAHLLARILAASPSQARNQP